MDKKTRERSAEDQKDKKKKKNTVVNKRRGHSPSDGGQMLRSEANKRKNIAKDARLKEKQKQKVAKKGKRNAGVLRARRAKERQDAAKQRKQEQTFWQTKFSAQYEAIQQREREERATKVREKKEAHVPQL